MAELKIASAVILCQRDDVRDALRQELKASGLEAENIGSARTAKEALALLANKEAVFIICDWTVGPDQVFEVLKATRGENRVETVPMLLIAAQMDLNILAVAKEYLISRVHSGEISRSNIKREIRELMRETRDLGPVKQLMIKVESLLLKGDLPAAKTILMQLHEKAPTNNRVSLELAEIMIELEEWDAALSLLGTVENGDDPPYARAKHLLARIYLKKGQTEKAVEALEGAQLVNPYNIDRLMQMGEILMTLNKPAEAKEAFGSILDFAPASKPAKIAVSQSMLELGEINEALAFLRDSSSSRELASVFNTSAILAIKRGEHEKAISLYRSAASALGNHPQVMARLMFNMGVGFVKWKKPGKGLECFQKAVELDPSYDDAKHNLAALREKKKAPPSTMPEAADPFNDLQGMDEQLGQGDSAGTLSLSFNTDFDAHFGNDDELE